MNNWRAYALGTTFPSTAFVRDQFERAARRLREITQELLEIEDKLKKEKGDGSVAVKKVKWLIQNDRIGKLVRRARSAKHDLISSIVLQHTQHIICIEQSIMRVEQGFGRVVLGSVRMER
jgi:hypothetical protein